MGRKIIQKNIFGEDEIVTESKTRSRSEVFNDYESFEEKFKPKKTTDDCYTPEDVYQAIRNWVSENITSMGGRRVVRPFYPGGDYRNFDYGGDCFVLDNPPFSILVEIRSFYAERRIPYFLFAPSLTLFSRLGADEDNVTFIVANASIIYENGANVKTGFITNCMSGGLRISVRCDLREVIERVQKERKRDKRELPVYDYPAHVVSAALLQKIAQPGFVLDFPKEECEYVRTLDAQRKAGKSIFGNGFFISERLAAERMAAERMPAERMPAREKHIWELSERERMIIKRLSGNP